MDENNRKFSLRDCLNTDWKQLQIFGGQIARPKRIFDHFCPRFAPVVMIRIAYWLYLRRLHRMAKLISFFNFVIFGLEVPTRLAIGEGLVIPHTQGTIIGAGFVGRNVTIFQQVTLGAKLVDFDYDISQRPHVCDNVTITAGAKIIGPIRLGRGCTIGANAVVLSDIAEEALAVGIPAKAVPKIPNATR